MSSGARIAIPAPTVQEITRGIDARTARDPAFSMRMWWFAGLLDHDLVDVIPLTKHGALLAGAMLARLPHPPTRDHRRHGTRAQQRAAWALDVQIAACAFAGGYGVLTENVDDFGVLRDAITELLPGVPPLAVADARV
jgi:predicted nucleic acid-binding protein